MVIRKFSFSSTPNIYFGAGSYAKITEIIEKKALSVLIITGVRSFRSSDKWDKLLDSISLRSVTYYELTVSGEPSPELIDSAVSEFKDKNIDMVVSIGGGSVIDAGKAISAMLTQNVSVVEFLEGVGTGASHDGKKIPFIAVPTTAGTGSEATKNAVLSRVGNEGFKKSLRHDNFVPDFAVVDPELMISCPPDITAACGMDAFTQLLESYVSSKANPMTDALAASGLQYIKNCLVKAYTDGGSLDARTGMAYASFMSGITLANAGLGVVHGLASPIGGYFDVPHGVICGSLVGAATHVTIDKLKNQGETGKLFLEQYAKAGALLTGCNRTDIDYLCDILIKKIDEWSEILHIPTLSDYGITSSDYDTIIDGTGNKNNPVNLDREEIRSILQRC
ncbi:MAG: iron-containing alcohol dehydrogenase [Candidatus Latescibacteria bacterium]|nr:iron-containing alcohol dehydrogenase [Candidatus Latescibacterota bacterium]